MSTLLATTSTASGGGGFGVLRDAFHRMDILNRPDELLDALSGMPLILASVIVVVGALCVLNGYRWHKWVIVALAFLAGLGLGHLLSAYVGRSVIVAISLGLLCAIISTPLLKITVAVFGGITGAFIGANIWSAIHGAPGSATGIGADSHWIGALMGFIVIAMASLILFRLVIMLFTSVGGAAMVVFGAVTILLHVPAWESAVKQSLTTNPVILPLLLCVAAVAGFVLQHSRVKEQKGGAPAQKGS